MLRPVSGCALHVLEIIIPGRLGRRSVLTQLMRCGTEGRARNPKRYSDFTPEGVPAAMTPSRGIAAREENAPRRRVGGSVCARDVIPMYEVGSIMQGALGGGNEK